MAWRCDGLRADGLLLAGAAVSASGGLSARPPDMQERPYPSRQRWSDASLAPTDRSLGPAV